MKELSKSEETFLIAIYRLKDEAYGVAICDKIHELTGKMYTFGTLYKILDQVVRHGYAIKEEGEPSKERGGRRKMFYRLTEEGIEGLKNSYKFRASLWHGLDIVSSDGKVSQ